VAPLEGCLVSLPPRVLSPLAGQSDATHAAVSPSRRLAPDTSPATSPAAYCADPFADEAAATAEEEEETQNVTKGKAYVHVRVQQRNGRKSLTTVQVCRMCAVAVLSEGCGQGTKSTNCYRHLTHTHTRTPLQGIDTAVDYKKVLKALKKEFCCNGTVVEDPEHGTVIQLQGDQRANVSTFLINEGIVKKDNIKIHGF
jgi:translation initiation factor 1